MRIPRLPLKTFALLAVLSACDSGHTSAPTATTMGVAASNAGPSTAAVTSDAAATSAVSTSGTATSTTGSITPPPGGFVYQTGRGCAPGSMTDSGQLQGQWGKVKTTVAGLEYWLQVNQWGTPTPVQTMSYGGGVFFRMAQQGASSPTTAGPTGFPSIFIGGNSGNITNNSNLPKQVASIAAIPTAWTWDDAGTLQAAQTNAYNVTYDVWFSVGADGEPNASHPSGAFLMVWYHKPFDVTPIGIAISQGVSVANVPGTWNVFLGTNQNTPVISYTATGTIHSMDFDLNDFIQDAIARGGSVQPTHYLTNVFAGFEIWRGGANIATTSFCAQVL